MPTKETMAVIEKTLETVEETIDTVERIPKLRLNGTTKKQQLVILGVTAGVSLVAGGTLAHFFTKKRVQAKYEQLIVDEVAAAKAFYSKLNKLDPVTLAKDITDQSSSESFREAVMAVNKYAGGQFADKDPMEEHVSSNMHNVFSDNTPVDDTFNIDEEQITRTEEAPYVISREEFFENSTDFVQSTISYFDEDGVLVDEQDQPIEDSENTIGEYNLSRFGQGSHDNKIVYVRNDRLQQEYEIVKSEGSYTREVLGFIEHGDRPGSRKQRRFRGDDG